MGRGACLAAVKAAVRLWGRVSRRGDGVGGADGACLSAFVLPHLHLEGW